MYDHNEAFLEINREKTSRPGVKVVVFGNNLYVASKEKSQYERARSFIHLLTNKMVLEGRKFILRIT